MGRRDISDDKGAKTGRVFIDSAGEAETPITGCCSSLSAPDVGSDEWEDTQSACFDNNRDYTQDPPPHPSVSREELLRRIDECHGLCLGDDNVDNFIESQKTTESSIELMMAFSLEHNDRASLL